MNDVDRFEVTPITKEAQVAASPGGNRRCPTTGETKNSCKCRPCIGRRARGKGKKKQRDARKSMEKVFGVAGKYATQTGDEENWRMRVRAEVKSGGMAKTVDTFYRKCRGQADRPEVKAEGDTRPFVAIAMPDGLPYGYLVVRTDHLERLKEAFDCEEVAQ